MTSRDALLAELRFLYCQHAKLALEAKSITLALENGFSVVRALQEMDRFGLSAGPDDFQQTFWEIYSGWRARDEQRRAA